jgi:cytochrome bd-type quinol oxidase subunit 2
MAWLFSCLLIGLIVSAYVISAHVLVGSDVPSSASQADQRDTTYFAIHAGGLLFALVAGFTLGKFLNGLGVAFGLLFFVVVATVMSAGQIAAYQAACNGQNDIIRHWTC